MSTQAGSKQAGVAAWGHAAVEVGGWLVALSVGALCYCLGGTTALGGALSRETLGQVWQQQAEGHFSSSTGVWWLLIVGVLVLLGFLGPRRLLHDMLPAPRSAFVMVLGVLAGALGIVFCFVRVAWLGWIVALFLGTIVSAVSSHVPQLHRKPWRTAGISTGSALFVLFVTQLVEGPGDAALALPWLAGIGGLLLIVASVGVYLIGTPALADLPAPTGVIPKRALRGSVRAASPVGFPWVCHVMVAILAGTFVLALPAVTENGFGMAGFALVLCGVLLGWAAGYEVGPTFAPGMTRPRLTSFALLGAGIMELGVGILTELSGIAVFSALVAFCVGLGLRAQDYDVHRRYGFAVGTVVALVLAAVIPTAAVRFNDDFIWHVAPSMNAHLVLGAVGVISGIVALFVFSPQGIRGISVDVVHAFTPMPAEEGPGTGGAVAGADADGEAATTVLAPGNPGAGGGDAPVGDGAARDSALHIPDSHVPAAGVFITFEGVDGSGKTTQLRLLAQHLKDHGLSDVVSTREPGGTPAGKQIRHVVQGGEPVAPRSEALLYAADRAQHVAGLVGPALKRGAVVLGDRYIDSSIAYQAAGRQLSAADIGTISRWAAAGLVPHLTVLIDTDLDSAGERTSGRGNQNHLDQETQDFKVRVRDTFQRLAADNPDRYVVIDGSGDVEQVAAAVAKAVDPLVAALVPGYQPADAYDDGELDERLQQADDQVEEADADVEYADVSDEVAGDESALEDEASAGGEATDAESGGLAGADATAGAPAGNTPVEVGSDQSDDPAADDEALEMPEFLRERAATVATDPILNRDDPFGENATVHAPGVPGGAAAPADEPAESADGAAGEAETRVQPQSPSAHGRKQDLDRLRAQAEIERKARERLRQARSRQQRGDG